MFTSTQDSLALVGLYPKHTYGRTWDLAPLSAPQTCFYLSAVFQLVTLAFFTLGSGVQEADSKPVLQKATLPGIRM